MAKLMESIEKVDQNANGVNELGLTLMYSHVLFFILFSNVFNLLNIKKMLKC